tara:strand:- start:21 stop:818 length:798 start_codon:yes stop_codon:yes gene_type:complete
MIVLMMTLVMFSASLSGCLGGDDDAEEKSDIDLIIYYDTTFGTIQENIQNGNQVSFSGVELTFNYAFTKSGAGEITTFYFESGDGSTRTEVDANETGEITYNYVTHGLFTATLGALDDAGNDEQITLTIRIDKTTQWSESGTTNPGTMNIDTTPDCECNSPSQIEIDSVVENPANTLGFGGGPVTVTWKLTSSEVERESQPEQLGDGQDASWLHNEIGPSPEIWKLDVELNHNEEQVNIDHNVSIKYNADESSPNPLPTGQTPEE